MSPSNLPEGDELFLSNEEGTYAAACNKVLCMLDQTSGKHSENPPLKTPKPAKHFISRSISTHCSLLAIDCSENIDAAIIPLKRSKNATTVRGMGQSLEAQIVISVNGSDEGDLHEPQDNVKIMQIDTDNVESASQDVVASHLQRLRVSFEHSNAREIPLNQHIATYFHYLRAVHAAPTVKEHKQAVSHFRDYVYMTTYAKVLARFTADSKQHAIPANFWQVLTQHDDAFLESQIPIPAALKGKSPTKAQADLIRMELEAMNTDPDSKTIKLWTTAPIYNDSRDRARFQLLLDRHLQGAKRALETLSRVMEELGTSWSASDKSDTIKLEEVQDAVEQAAVGMVLLHKFLDKFADFLDLHLQWLAECAGDKDSEADERGTDVPDRYASWAQSAREYLRYLCTDEKNIRRAVGTVPGRRTAEQKYEAALVRNARISVLRVNTKSKRSCDPIDKDFLTSLLKYEPKLKINFLLANMTDKVDILSTTRASRPVHREAALLSLVALAKTPAITDAWLQQNEISTTRTDLLEIFPASSCTIYLSQRCCAACDEVRFQLQELGTSVHDSSNPWLNQPWSSEFSLPRCIPRYLGATFISGIARIAARKLMDWQRELMIRRDDKVLARSMCSKLHIAPEKEPMSSFRLRVVEVDPPEKRAEHDRFRREHTPSMAAFPEGQQRT